MTRVKICGISTFEDGRVALDEGADFLGFVFYPPSHRYIEPVAAAKLIERLRAHRPTGWQTVGVVVNIPIDAMNEIAERCALDLTQVCGDEDEAYCHALSTPAIKALKLDGRAPLTHVLFDPTLHGARRILVDSHRDGMYGGTGETSDWAALRPYVGHSILAGGLDPENVARAIQLAQPWGVDVSSGVERDMRKDPTLIREFLRAVHALDGVPQ
jgi:phosphoribosylanthranilate isomerase